MMRPIPPRDFSRGGKARGGGGGGGGSVVCVVWCKGTAALLLLRAGWRAGWLASVRVGTDPDHQPVNFFDVGIFLKAPPAVPLGIGLPKPQGVFWLCDCLLIVCSLTV